MKCDNINSEHLSLLSKVKKSALKFNNNDAPQKPSTLNAFSKWFTRGKKARKGKNKQPQITKRADKLRVKISPLFFVMALFFVAIGQFYEFICAVTAVIMHEFSHARVARIRGYALNELKLMPYGACLYGEFEGVLPIDETLIALAGPALNLVLSVLFVALWWVYPASYPFTNSFVACNLYVGIFNLLPVYPMDGGRIVLAALSHNLPRSRAYKIMRKISVVTAIAAVALIIVSVVHSVNITLIAVGFFLVVSALIPDKSCKYASLYDEAYRIERLKNGCAVYEFAVLNTMTALQVKRKFRAGKLNRITVLSNEFKTLGTIDEGEFIAAMLRSSQLTQAGEILNIVNRNNNQSACNT